MHYSSLYKQTLLHKNVGLIQYNIVLSLFADEEKIQMLLPFAIPFRLRIENKMLVPSSSDVCKWLLQIKITLLLAKIHFSVAQLISNERP